MNVSTEIIYIVILLLATLLLAIIALIALFIRSEKRYVNLRTMGQNDNDDTVIDTAQKISAEIIKKAETEAKKIVDSSKLASEKYDSIVDNVTKSIINSWNDKSSHILDTEMKKMLEDISQKDKKTLEAYRSQKMGEIDKKIEEFVKLLGKKIVAREISLDEHKQLISNALEEAYKNGQFN